MHIDAAMLGQELTEGRHGNVLEEVLHRLRDGVRGHVAVDLGLLRDGNCPLAVGGEPSSPQTALLQADVHRVFLVAVVRQAAEAAQLDHGGRRHFGWWNGASRAKVHVVVHPHQGRFVGRVLIFALALRPAQLVPPVARREVRPEELQGGPNVMALGIKVGDVHAANDVGGHALAVR
eukprot:8385369-Alexandrium_andersonii.AAC.1